MTLPHSVVSNFCYFERLLYGEHITFASAVLLRFTLHGALFVHVYYFWGGSRAAWGIFGKKVVQDQARSIDSGWNPPAHKGCTAQQQASLFFLVNQQGGNR